MSAVYPETTYTSPATETQEDTSVPADLIPDPEPDEIDRLLSEPVGPVTLSSGLEVNVRNLKLREFLRLLKIITRGAGSVLNDGLNLDFEDNEKFVTSLMGMILFSVPEAEQETIDFIRSMTEPAHLSTNADDNVRQYEQLAETLENPELEDTIDLLTMIVRKEGADLRALGKRLQKMFAVARKMGAVPNNLTSN